jgi:hypothetical protein
VSATAIRSTNLGFDVVSLPWFTKVVKFNFAKLPVNQFYGISQFLMN